VALHPYYADSKEPFAVWVTNIATGRWGWTQPIAVPERCRVELYWQLMPGETQPQVQDEFAAWWNEITAARSDLFATPPAIEVPIRWLPGCAIPPDHPLVTEFAASAASLDLSLPVRGMDAPSDMYVFQNLFDTPALMFGPSGSGAHQADEYVDIASLLDATRALARFVCRWCGIAHTT
jgi:acetylornithine deacetylase